MIFTKLLKFVDLLFQIHFYFWEIYLENGEATPDLPVLSI